MLDRNTLFDFLKLGNEALIQVNKNKKGKEKRKHRTNFVSQNQNSLLDSVTNFVFQSFGSNMSRKRKEKEKEKEKKKEKEKEKNWKKEKEKEKEKNWEKEKVEEEIRMALKRKRILKKRPIYTRSLLKPFKSFQESVRKFSKTPIRMVVSTINYSQTISKLDNKVLDREFFCSLTLSSKLSKLIYETDQTKFEKSNLVQSYRLNKDKNALIKWGIFQTWPKTDHLYLTFKGTSTLRDAFVDGLCVPKEYDPTSNNNMSNQKPQCHSKLNFSMHCGVYEAMEPCFDTILETLKVKINTLNPKKIILTGHSLGGGYALCFLMLLHSRAEKLFWEIKSKLYLITFGSPKVIYSYNQNYNLFKTTMKRLGIWTRCFEVINNTDIVPRILGSTKVTEEISSLVNIKQELIDWLQFFRPFGKQLLIVEENSHIRFKLIKKKYYQTIMSPLHCNLVSLLTNHKIDQYISNIESYDL
ncbi:lipase family protein [Anaeramoeba flamelloides]|uniref:Lipase family protein n=1 Tax=Anaeramoeba flamelloides TaxID=1746091 RepID=A0AAV7ZZQ0_9EUKA|nr:lipase family protein [Anaeramoeba flamelloides]